jgi:hypothetical protein
MQPRTIVDGNSLFKNFGEQSLYTVLPNYFGHIRLGSSRVIS